MATFEKRISNSGQISWRARIRRDGAQQLTKTFARKSDAEAWAREHELRLDRGFGLPDRAALLKPLSAGIDRWLEDRLPHMSPDDQNNNRQMLEWWRSQLGAVAMVRIDPQMIEAAAKRLHDETDDKGQRVRTPARVNRYVQTLSRALGYCHRTLRWIPGNPCAGVRHYKEPPGRTGFLSEADTAKLLAAVDASNNAGFSLFVRIALGCGPRRGEIERLRWGDIDPVHRRITFRATKTNELRTTPLPAALVPLIKEFGKIRPTDPSARVFPQKYRTHWDEVQRVLPEGIVFHSIRHSTASHLMMSGASTLDVMTILGHKSPSMARRYSHLSDDHVRSQLERASTKLLK